MQALRLLVALGALLFASAAKPLLPRFKWGQNKELVFVSVLVRDLERGSVAVSLPTEGDLQFRAKTEKGDEVALDLPLREDVKQDSLKWEVSARPDKWGTAVVITLSKRNAHRWDLLVADPKPFKSLMDKDWSREDQTLEPEEELPYAEEHAAYLLTITQKNLNKTLAKFPTLVVNVRYPWCSQCKTQDETFAKAAKLAKAKAKKEPAWKRVAFGVVDAREERALARQLGAKCDFSCEYSVFGGPEEEAVTIKSKWSDAELLTEVARFHGPSVKVLGSEQEAAALREQNSTCLGGFASDKDPEYAVFRRVAGLMRGELVFAATFGASRQVEVWPQKQNFSFKYEGTLGDNGTALLSWVKPRAVPLLQEYTWQMRETYDKLGLPVASVWINDEDKNPAFEKIVRHAVRRVAKKYVGKVAFVEKKKSSYSYELRDYGLAAPESYPAFGMASNASYQSVKYGFEVTPEVATSVQDFWSDADKVAEQLSSFCDKVLAGSWPEAHESAAPQKDWTKGTVKQLVWKTYSEISNPEKPLLLEVYGKYRTENERRLKEGENLAAALAPFGDVFTVARYDTAENYLPQGEIKREKYASDTEWYWIAAGGAAKKLTKPKKDAPIGAVLEFAKRQSGADFDVDAVKARFEELMLENPAPTTTPRPSRGGEADGLGGLGDFGDFGDLSAELAKKSEL